jgi:hypothetical protein
LVFGRTFPMKLGFPIFLLVRNQVTHLKECRRWGGMYYVPFQTKKFLLNIFARAALMPGHVSIMCVCVCVESCLPRWDCAPLRPCWVGLLRPSGYYTRGPTPESRLLFLPPNARARAVCVSGRGLADYGTRVSSVLAEIATLPFVL